MGGPRLMDHERLIGGKFFSSPRAPESKAGPRGVRGRKYGAERRELLAAACSVVGTDRAYTADGGLDPDVADVYKRLRIEAIEESMADEVTLDARLWARRGWPKDPRLADVPEGRRAHWVEAYAIEAHRLGKSPEGPTGNDARRLAMAILSVETGDPVAIQHVMDLRHAERLEAAEAAGDVEELEALRGHHDEGRLNAADVDLANCGDDDGAADEVRLALAAGRRNLFTDTSVVVTQAELDEKFRRQRLRWSSMRSRARSTGGSVEITGAEDQS